jgi:hypothetical protein
MKSGGEGKVTYDSSSRDVKHDNPAVPLIVNQEHGLNQVVKELTKAFQTPIAVPSKASSPIITGIDAESGMA